MRSQNGLIRVNIKPYIAYAVTSSCIFKIFFMNVRNLKYILSRKVLRCLTQSGEKYSTKNIKTGEKVEAFFALTSVI
jgi:hypothetical protein